MLILMKMNIISKTTGPDLWVFKQEFSWSKMCLGLKNSSYCKYSGSQDTEAVGQGKVTQIWRLILAIESRIQ